MIDSTCPPRMLIRMNVILGMRHQTKYITFWVTNTSNIKNGAVGIERIFTICRRSICTGVSKGNLVIVHKRRKRKEVGGLKIAFAMRNRTFDELIQSLC